MLSQSKNRVQAIKSKFENLNVENEPLVLRKKNLNKQLCKQNYNGDVTENNFDKENTTLSYMDKIHESSGIKPNSSYLYNNEVKRVEVKKTLTRQTSDPGKKLHRSHAFRCDRSQKIGDSPKRHGSCYGRSETGDFTLKMGDRKLSKDRLKRLGNLLENQMKKENFQVNKDSSIIVGEVVNVCDNDNVAYNLEDSICNDNHIPYNSIPDSEVPKHILDQYAKVVKPKKNDADKQDAMTDSGVSSETENLDEERNGRTKKLVSQFEKTDHEILPTDSNLDSMNNLCISSETMRLERKNPHLKLTDTLKKALKQPLPTGPPPKKPPRTFGASPTPIKERKDPKKMLEKLEQHLHKREQQNSSKNIYDIAETDLSTEKPKEMHYLCTEILDITQRTLLPNYNKDLSTNCFNKLNCAMLMNSTMSLPYTRLSPTNCCTCSNDSLSNSGKLTTFVSDTQNKCTNCNMNDDKFKCHLNKCGRSEFYIDNEPIYDEPYIGNETDTTYSKDNEKKNRYGTLNSSKLSKNFSKSLEDLRTTKTAEKQQIYDIPYDITRSKPVSSSSPKSDFQKLRSNFENGFRQSQVEVKVKEITTEPKKTEKPALLTPKPDFVFTKNKVSKSTENLAGDFKTAKRNVERKFGTEKRYRNRCETNSNIRMSLPKKDNMQLDIDRENLNRLMNEIYDTVTAVCDMDDHKPGSFPTESDGSTSEDSVKITRSLTEKRKNYVRRVSSRVAYLDQKNVKVQRFRHQTSICSYKSEVIDNPYSTFRSWKSFRTSQNNLAKDKMNESDSKNNLTDASGNALSMDFSDSSIDNVSIDEKTGCVDIDLPFETRDKGLFNISLLVGLNYMSGEAYVKSVFPSQVHVPPHIENLIFPETLSWTSNGEWSADASAQCYSLVLTDERGERSYGYCRRVLPEGATTCLPLCYCIIGKYRAPGFYYKVLQEIESHHGSSETEIQSILQQLFDTDFPDPGEEITITYSNTSRRSIELDTMKCKTMPDLRRSGGKSDEQYLEGFADKSESLGDELPRFLDLENNNDVKSGRYTPRPKILKRPIEPRADEDNLSVLLDSLGAGLVIKVFGSLLLERKVIVISDQLSVLSSCMEALQWSLYPLVWQQPLISCIPSAIQRDVLEAPLPILAGMLTCKPTDTTIHEGMLIDLRHPSKVLHCQGDESTILPTASYKTLKTALQMESLKYKDRSEDSKTRNVMISEAFLRFFVDILGDFWRFFAEGEVKDGALGKGGVVFDKEAFTKSATSKQNQYFLEWFTETAMFNHFIQNMATCHRRRASSASSTTVDEGFVDAPLPNFYQLFEERVRNRSKSDSHKNSESKNYRSAVNKKVKLLKSKLRDLIT